ncbi:hypothetical protein HJG60_009290 [Phyllostomus discolor]|uniref:Uncharacterized protein n=1 Tax=Phyllostomus discolor TaxID=89673 RepID=A0A834DHJ1_9CHIR|nr:hypothetical protein HJG60_009290 [Phyllostomus discolor]
MFGCLLCTGCWYSREKHKSILNMLTIQIGLETPSCNYVTSVKHARNFGGWPYSVSDMTTPTCKETTDLPPQSFHPSPSLEPSLGNLAELLSSAGNSHWDSSPLAGAPSVNNYNAFFPGWSIQNLLLMLNSGRS